MDRTWLTAIALTQIGFILVAVVIFLITPRSGKIALFELGLVLILAFITETVSAIGALIFRTNMNLAANIFDLLRLPLILLLFNRKITWKNTSRIVYTAIAVFLVFGLINLFFIQKPNGLDSYTKTFTAVTMISASLIYFYILIRELPTESITKLPMFWINTAFLVYYSGIFFVYLSTDYLINVVKDDLINPWIIHNFLGLVYYSILAISLWLHRSNSLLGSRAPSN